SDPVGFHTFTVIFPASISQHAFMSLRLQCSTLFGRDPASTATAGNHIDKQVLHACLTPFIPYLNVFIPRFSRSDHNRLPHSWFYQNNLPIIPDHDFS